MLKKKARRGTEKFLNLYPSSVNVELRNKDVNEQGEK
jgi:hypothetical protein